MPAGRRSGTAGRPLPYDLGHAAFGRDGYLMIRGALGPDRSVRSCGPTGTRFKVA